MKKLSMVITFAILISMNSFANSRTLKTEEQIVVYNALGFVIPSIASPDITLTDCLLSEVKRPARDSYFVVACTYTFKNLFVGTAFFNQVEFSSNGDTINSVQFRSLYDERNLQ